MEERASLEHLKSWARQMETAGLPAWEDLPDLPGMEAEGQLRLGEDGALLDGEPAAETEKR